MNANETRDEAQHILEAVRTIENSPELKIEAQTNPDNVMDRLGLAGIARHAVAFAIAAAVAVPAAQSARVLPDGVWQ